MPIAPDYMALNDALQKKYYQRAVDLMQGKGLEGYGIDENVLRQAHQALLDALQVDRSADVSGGEARFVAPYLNSSDPALRTAAQQYVIQKRGLLENPLTYEEFRKFASPDRVTNAWARDRYADLLETWWQTNPSDPEAQRAVREWYERGGGPQQPMSYNAWRAYTQPYASMYVSPEFDRSAAPAPYIPTPTATTPYNQRQVLRSLANQVLKATDPESRQLAPSGAQQLVVPREVALDWMGRAVDEAARLGLGLIPPQQITLPPLEASRILREILGGNALSGTPTVVPSGTSTPTTVPAPAPATVPTSYRITPGPANDPAWQRYLSEMGGIVPGPIEFTPVASTPTPSRSAGGQAPASTRARTPQEMEANLIKHIVYRQYRTPQEARNAVDTYTQDPVVKAMVLDWLSTNQTWDTVPPPETVQQ